MDGIPEYPSEYGSDFDSAVQKLFPQNRTRQYLRKVLKQYDIGFISAAMLGRRLIELVRSPSHLQLFEVCRRLVRLSDQIEYSDTLPHYDENRTIRRNLVRKYLTDDLGFSMCGGRDQNCGLFISDVTRSTIAWNSGLRPGMEVTRVNGMRVKRATHRMFVDYVRICFQLDLEIRVIGMFPIASVSGLMRWQFALWKEDQFNELVHDRKMVPLRPSKTWNVVPFMKEIRVLIKDASHSLGLRVREANGGVRVLSIKQGSIAAKAKLLKNDLIVECNDKRLEDRDFHECVAALQCEAPFLIKIIREKHYGVDPSKGC